MRSIILTLGLVLGLAAFISVSSARAAEKDTKTEADKWGNLSGKFVFRGEVPPVEYYEVLKDTAVIGTERLPKERLVVDAKTKGVANVVLYLFTPTDEPPAIHSSYEKADSKDARWQIKGLRYVPHVIAVRTGQKLIVENKDPVAHHAEINAFRNPLISPIITAGDMTRTFKVREPAPAKAQCSIHPWMNGIVVIQNHPYVAISSTDGGFEIKNLPVGEHTFRLWHEGPGWFRQITRDGKAESLEKGKLTIEIKPGDNKLGVIELAAEQFERQRASRSSEDKPTTQP